MSRNIAIVIPSRKPCTQTSVAIDNTSTLLLAANGNRSLMEFQNRSDVDIYLSFDGDAADADGFVLVANGGSWSSGLVVSTDAVYAITASGSSKKIAVKEMS